MKIVLDNNVIIDAFSPNEVFEDDAKEVFNVLAEQRISAYLCANSLTDIYYILRKSNGIEKTKSDIAKLIAMFGIIPLTAEECAFALSLEMNDYEDAVIMACAHNAGIDYIISRDKAFLNTESLVSVITPREFLEKF
jgi:predicted nucleic acid-binding protein